MKKLIYILLLTLSLPFVSNSQTWQSVGTPTALRKIVGSDTLRRFSLGAYGYDYWLSAYQTKKIVSDTAAKLRVQRDSLLIANYYLKTTSDNRFAPLFGLKKRGIVFGGNDTKSAQDSTNLNYDSFQTRFNTIKASIGQSMTKIDTVFFIGDSNDKGYGLTDTLMQHTSLLAAKLRAVESNKAITGLTMQDGTPSGYGGSVVNHLNIVPYYTPGMNNYLYICLGTNDIVINSGSYTPALYKAAMQTLYNTVITRRWPASRVIFKSPPFISNYTYAVPYVATLSRHKEYRDTVASFAKANNTKYLDLLDITTRNGDATLMQSDGLHFNIKGHGIIAAAEYSVLNSAEIYGDAGVTGILDAPYIKDNPNFYSVERQTLSTINSYTEIGYIQYTKNISDFIDITLNNTDTLNFPFSGSIPFGPSGYRYVVRGNSWMVPNVWYTVRPSEVTGLSVGWEGINNYSVDFQIKLVSSSNRSTRVYMRLKAKRASQSQKYNVHIQTKDKIGTSYFTPTAVTGIDASAPSGYLGTQTSFEAWDSSALSQQHQISGVLLLPNRATGTPGTDSLLVVSDISAALKSSVKKISASYYQSALVSGTNIKTVGGISVLGSGDIANPNFSISVQTLKIAMGIAPAGIASLSFFNANPITGGVTAGGNQTTATIQSDVTTFGFGYRTVLNTAAASFTIPKISHYAATQGTIGAGSVATVQNGFEADATMIGAGLNYGFRGSIPSGSGRWNIYADGTANNHLSGNTLMGTTTDNGEKLQVNGKITVSTAPTNSTDVVRKTELDLRELLANKSTTTSLGTSNTLYPTQNAVKTYVDTQNATMELLANKSTATSLGTSDTFYPTQNAVKTYVDASITLKQNLVALTTTGTGAAAFNQFTGALNIPTPTVGVTNVSSANSDISVATGTTTPVLTFNAAGYVNTIGNQTGIVGNKTWIGDQTVNGKDLSVLQSAGLGGNISSTFLSSATSLQITDGVADYFPSGKVALYSKSGNFTFLNTGASFSMGFSTTGISANRIANWQDASGIVAYTSQLPIAGSFSGVGTATTTFTVTIGQTMANTTYKVNITSTSLLGAAQFYVSAKSTTTFTVTYMTGLTGTLSFDWSVYP